jgi:predicted ATPase
MGEVREKQKEFQLGVLDMQIEQENSIHPDDIVFLDRAIPDSLAYYHFLGLEPDEKLMNVLKKTSYKKVFILELLPLVNDYARNEDPAAQKKIHELITEVYESLSLPLIHVPVMSAAQRVDFILKNL